MRQIHWVYLAAGGLIAAASPTWAQSSTPPSAQQNVRESQQYEQLLCTNPAFRAKRIAQECGPLQGSEFYDSCVASFQCGAGERPVRPRGTPPSEKIR